MGWTEAFVPGTCTAPQDGCFSQAQAAVVNSAARRLVRRINVEAEGQRRIAAEAQQHAHARDGAAAASELQRRRPRLTAAAPTGSVVVDLIRKVRKKLFKNRGVEPISGEKVRWRVEGAASVRPFVLAGVKKPSLLARAAPALHLALVGTAHGGEERCMGVRRVGAAGIGHWECYARPAGPARARTALSWRRSGEVFFSVKLHVLCAVS